MKLAKKYITSIFGVVILAFTLGCQTKENNFLYGSWILENSGTTSEEVIGFTISEEGFASTINVRSKHYETWLLDYDALILEGTSIDDSSFAFLSDTLYIKSLTKDHLIVSYKEEKYHYIKEQ